MLKKLFGCLLVLVVLSLVPLMAIAADQIELRVSWWGSQNRHDRTIKVIEMFQQEHPDIKIVYEFANWDDYWTKLLTQAAGGNLPDVMQQDYARIEEFVSKKLLLPLDDYVKDGVLNLSNVEESLLAGGRLNGKLYAINLGANSQCLAIDVDAFKKAGMELPKQNWTLADFEKIALEFKAKTGLYIIGAQLNNEQQWKSLYLSLGQWAYSKDGKSLGYTDDQPLIDYLKMVLRLQEAGAIPPMAEELELMKQGIEAEPMVKGKAAMEYLWSNQIVAVAKAAGEGRHFVLNHLPRMKPDGPAANYVKPSQFFSVTSHSKHPKEAAMFIDYFTNSVEANKVLLAERGVPISSVVAKALEPLLTDSQKEMFAYMARVAKDNSPLPPPDPKNHAEFMNTVYLPAVIQPIRFGKLSVEDGVKLLRERSKDILEQ
jgi:multiple sugar transport system substrate-binding protein